MTAAQICAPITTADQLRVAATKREATLQAELALRGYEMQRLADGSFMVARWGLLKPLAGLPEVEDFARLVGAIGGAG